MLRQLSESAILFGARGWHQRSARARIQSQASWPKDGWTLTAIPFVTAGSLRHLAQEMVTANVAQLTFEKGLLLEQTPPVKVYYFSDERSSSKRHLRLIKGKTSPRDTSREDPHGNARGRGIRPAAAAPRRPPRHVESDLGARSESRGSIAESAMCVFTAPRKLLRLYNRLQVHESHLSPPPLSSFHRCKQGA